MAQIASSALSTKFWQVDSADLPILFERYQILGIIGEGGMGTVFKGYHLNLKRHVAIKTLRIDHAHSTEMVSRFLKEMESVGQMDHPNVVRATDAGEKNGVFYLVMEYLCGLDLARLVAEKGRLGISDACEVTRQAAVGLDHIHQTLVHRDIKPSNLMLTAAGLVKILDLGLARFGFGDAGDRERTPVGLAVGTYAYMAPEQASHGAAIDGRADIYSLGCTLFKLLTGNAPFSGTKYDSAAKLLYAHGHVPLTAVEEFASIPEKLRPVLLRMVAKDPAERFATGREVALALAPFAASSQPACLLGESGGAVEPTMRPLAQPLPEALSRLTAPLVDTSREAPTASTGSVAPRPRGLGSKRVGALAVGLMIAALGTLALVYAPALIRPRDDIPDRAEPTLRNLDELKPYTSIRLLERAPLPVGCGLGDPTKYQWNDRVPNLHVIGGHNTLFLLGTTTRSQYSFEANIAQSPWTGEVGIFWGYHEDAEVRAAKVPGQTFAWFQMLRIQHRTNAKQENLHFVQRLYGSLRFNPRGEIAPGTFSPSIAEIAVPSRPAILKIEIDGDRLKSAHFAGLPLKELFSPEANNLCKTEKYQGGLGVFTLAHPATFSDVRFIANSKD